jgi:glycosyltransferase involved in cell wall biosynthesis
MTKEQQMTSKRKIGIVSLSDIDYGLDLAFALNDAGENVVLYMSRKNFSLAMSGRDRAEDIVYEKGLLPKDVKLRLFDTPRMRDPRSFIAYNKLNQLMRSDSIDVAEILVGSGELWLAVLAFLLHGIPVCSTMREPKPNLGERLPSSIVLAVNQLLAWNSDVVVVNGVDHELMVQKMYGLPAHRTHFVPLPPRETTLRWASRRIPEDPGLILFFGSVDARKGTEYLVRAQSMITESVDYARIVIAGHGTEFAHCRQLIQDPSRFELHEGFVPNEDAADLFQRASLVVLPYLTASTSGVLVTAQTFEKPVVATRVGSLPDYVEDGKTGLLVPPADEKELANAIIKLLQNDELRHQMGKNARERMNETRDESIRQTKIALGMAIERHNKSKKKTSRTLL